MDVDSVRIDCPCVIAPPIALIKRVMKRNDDRQQRDKADLQAKEGLYPKARKKYQRM